MTDATVSVREAAPDELAAVLGVLDGAALETDADRVRGAIDRGDVLAAVPGPTTAPADDTDGPTVPVGALVLDGAEIANVAVRRRRRGQGVGTALVEAAAARRGPLVARFDADVRPFYESLGFAVEPVGEGRYRGRFSPEDA